MSAVKTFGFCLVVAVMPVASSLFRIYVRQDAVQLGYELSLQERRRDQLRATQQELEVELAAATSPGRLSLMAQRLGLHPPQAGQYLSASPTARVAQKDEALETLEGLESDKAAASRSTHARP